MNFTSFATVYNRFLNKITDDMYMELTPEDTVKDLQRLLIAAIPGFEFPRKNLYSYTIQTAQIKENEMVEGDFLIGVVWNEMNMEPDTAPDVIVDRSFFAVELTEEEINILAILMMEGWLQRQVTSVENIRMKYTGSDFKMTSQANHLSKLLALQTECRRQSTHMQRLYKRRRTEYGVYRSNWDIFGPNYRGK